MNEDTRYSENGDDWLDGGSGNELLVNGQGNKRTLEFIDGFII